MGIIVVAIGAERHFRKAEECFLHKDPRGRLWRSEGGVISSRWRWTRPKETGKQNSRRRSDPNVIYLRQTGKKLFEAVSDEFDTYSGHD